jgi:hypothetical protein
MEEKATKKQGARSMEQAPSKKHERGTWSREHGAASRPIEEAGSMEQG